MLVNILFGYFAGTFMVVEKAHRGWQWNNIQRTVLILTTIVAAWLRVSFSVLAAVQLISCVVVLGVVLADLRRSAPEIFPSIRYWDGATVMQILRPSGHFALLFSCTFLAFQIPILVLQRIIGPVGVIGFTFMRTIFSTSRQILAAPTQSLGPEITNLFAKHDWKRLRGLYVHSELLIFACIPTISIGILLASPCLLSVWRVNRSGFFQVYPYVVCAAISILMATKEHKYQFQFSTNSHEQLARFIVGSAAAIARSRLRLPVLSALWPTYEARFSLDDLRRSCADVIFGHSPTNVDRLPLICHTGPILEHAMRDRGIRQADIDREKLLSFVPKPSPLATIFPYSS